MKILSFAMELIFGPLMYTTVMLCSIVVSVVWWRDRTLSYH